MATKKPRVIVTLEPEQYELLARVARVSDVSMASILREYVEMSFPMLEHLADLGEKFLAREVEVRETHKEAVARAIQAGQAIADELEESLSIGIGSMNLVAELLSRAGESPSEASASGASQPGAGVDPLLVTRGSGG